MIISEENAKFAAKLSPQVRMEMVQYGYNPLNPEDYQRYLQRQKPSGQMNEIMSKGLEEGQSLYKMGEGHMNSAKDMAVIKSALAEGEHNIDPDHLKNAPDVDFEHSNVWENTSEVNENSDPREIKKSLGDRVSNYAPRNVNEKLKQVLETKKVPIQIPKKIDTKTYITESTKASSLGYINACNYINSFIKQLKNPSNEGRIAFIEALNKTIVEEEKIHPNILQHYRDGITKAETELYNKIKTKK